MVEREREREGVVVSKERNEGGSSSRVLPIPETEFLLSNSSTRVLRDVAREAGVKVEELPLLPMQKEGRKEEKRREERLVWKDDGRDREDGKDGEEE